MERVVIVYTGDMRSHKLLAEVLDGLPDWLGGVFVGGSTAWKFRTARYWSFEAKRRGLLSHVGRVGSVKRVRAMRECGIGSIDSALPLFSKEKWVRFWKEVDSKQAALFDWKLDLWAGCVHSGRGGVRHG
jgi:hypothetical protein